MSVYLTIYLYTYMYLSIYVSFYQSFYQSINQTINLAICLSIYLSIDFLQVSLVLPMDLSINLSSYLLIYLYTMFTYPPTYHSVLTDFLNSERVIDCSKDSFINYRPIYLPHSLPILLIIPLSNSLLLFSSVFYSYYVHPFHRAYLTLVLCSRYVIAPSNKLSRQYSCWVLPG